NVDREHDKVGGHDAQCAPCEETAEVDALIARERREQLATYQVSAEDKEKIDTDPAEAIDPAGQFESEKRGVVNDDDDDGERAEKIETRLALTILKARVDSECERRCGFRHKLEEK